MKKGIVILFAATLGLAACNNYKKGPGGLEYIIHKNGDKAKIKEGDIVKMNFVQKNDKDSVLFNTWDMDQPQVFPVAKKMYDGDMNDVLLFFGEGDSATFKLNLDTMVARSGQPRPQGMEGKFAVFTVKIEKVLAKAAGEADSTFQTKARDFFEKDYKATMDKKKAAEAGKITKYISDNNLKTVTTATGLQYVISKPGDAVKPVLGDTLMLNYTGKLTGKKSDGKDNVFDTSDEKIAKETGKHNPMAQYGPRPIELGRAIPGFDEGLQLIGKGGKITLIIPSSLGYGEGGMPQAGISPFSPLVFEVELVDIKKPVAGQAGATVAPVAP